MRRHYETMHQNDKYEGNIGKEKLQKLKLSLTKQRRFLSILIRPTKMLLERVFLAICEMIVKSFTEGFSLRNCLLKASPIFSRKHRCVRQGTMCCVYQRCKLLSKCNRRISRFNTNKRNYN